MAERQPGRTPRRKNFSRWLVPAMIGLIIIGGTTFAIISIVGDRTQANIRQSLFEQQKERQLETTKALAEHVGSDLDSISARLEALSNVDLFQKGDLASDQARQLAQQYFDKAGQVSAADLLFVLDKDNVAVNIVGSAELQNFKNADFSSRDYVQKTRSTLAPVFSDGLYGMDNRYRIVVTQPIINRESGEYVGLIASSIPTADFFARYGNIYQINSQYLAALDTKANHLVHGNPDLIGKNFFDDLTQQFTQHNADLNNAMRQVLSGQPAFAVYQIAAGERLTSGYPIFVNNKLAYAVFIVTPTSLIYSNIDGILADERSQMFTQQIALAAAIGLFAALAAWLNRNLNNQVKKRTQELEYSNSQLAQANEQLARTNEQLKVHDKLQKEFVNVAAHELRTPVQPLLGAAELLELQLEGKEKIEVTRPEIEMILRNAMRLGRLSSDILEISRIDSGALVLNKETFSLAYIIAAAVKDSKIQSNYDPEKLAMSYCPDDIFVYADREKITEVVTNLLTNAIKFTKEGTISISTQRNSQNKVVLVSVKDTGSGIDADVLPRLFEKFVTKSEKGTGIGLYISKKIIEAHGGTISGQNNSNGPGATFQFTLSLAENEKYDEKEQAATEPPSGASKQSTE
ncbi:MAG TPA: sensor histidine kinase [Nitrososphaera sp.]|nr:sensor histidine kinase [Nitrososphaera sp.]